MLSISKSSINSLYEDTWRRTLTLLWAKVHEGRQKRSLLEQEQGVVERLGCKKFCFQKFGPDPAQTEDLSLQGRVRGILDVKLLTDRTPTPC